MKNLFILILLTPFFIWQSNMDCCYFIIDGNLWEMATPYEFDLEPLSSSTHNVTIITKHDNPEDTPKTLSFEILKSVRENKKWTFPYYKIIHNPEDAECFNPDILSYKAKVKK